MADGYKTFALITTDLFISCWNTGKSSSQWYCDFNINLGKKKAADLEFCRDSTLHLIGQFLTFTSGSLATSLSRFLTVVFSKLERVN